MYNEQQGNLVLGRSQGKEIFASCVLRLASWRRRKNLDTLLRRRKNLNTLPYRKPPRLGACGLIPGGGLVNGIAERNIGTVMFISRAMVHHAALH